MSGTFALSSARGRGVGAFAFSVGVRMGYSLPSFVEDRIPNGPFSGSPPPAADNSRKYITFVFSKIGYP